MENILFARVGYMKFYQGPKPGDEKPIGGGKFNADEIGHEAYNFVNIKGKLYGYFQPHMKKPYEINLSRIEQGFIGDKISNVLVIWFATNPIARGQVVIGWYANATVFRTIQSNNSLPARKNYSYNVVANERDCTLLPISKRRYPVGHQIDGIKEGNPGQANAFYLLDAKGNAKNFDDPQNSWIKGVIDYVQNYNGPRISSREDEIKEDVLTAGYSSGSQGFQSDVEVRLMIESYAMEICRNHFSSKGYEVEDVSATRPFDLIIRKDRKSQLVEVKGTQTAGEAIILTKNEVELSRAEGKRMVLFIVHSITTNNKTVKKGSGVVAIFDPWVVKEENLQPISYTYKTS